MKKKAKRVLAFLLSALMLLSNGNPVYAAEDTAVQGEVHQHAVVEDSLSVQTLSSEEAGQGENQSAGQTESKICYVRGDVNGDGYLNSRDAIYLLGYTSFAEQYPIDQDGDMNKDGKVDSKDAFYLLYVSIWPNKYVDWEGNIHVYGEPVWNWNTDGTVTAVFSCSCAEEKHTEQAEVKTDTDPATCYAAGSTVSTATVTFNGKEYTDSKTEVIPATEHKYAAEASCTMDRACVNEGCTYVEKAAGHQYEVDASKTVAATCTQEGSETYECKVCKDTYTVKTADKLAHTLDSDSKVSVPVEGKNCTFVDQYTCSACGEKISTEEYVKHTYVAKITKEATCASEGEKIYTCSVCDTVDSEKTEVIAKNDVHNWDEGVKNGNITTYTCSDCHTTKTTVDASTETSATVSQKDLANSKEIALKNASIQMDDKIKDSLGNEVAISAETVSKDALDLSADEKAQIRGEVYNFSLKSDGSTVSKFDGVMTITIPYTLQEDDDPDCIDVWFINDAGKLEICEGNYSNGYVTFTTNHFSYYTVTRLTPEQRCEKYGHTMVKKTVAATCESEGYTLEACQRCGKSTKTDVVAALGHEYEETVTPATCTKQGLVTKTCKHDGCKSTYANVLPATGHNWKLDEANSTPATCSATGVDKYICGNEGCTEAYEEKTDKLTHKYTDTVVAPTCEEMGYTSHVCSLCQNEYTDTKKAALGHDYKASWEWDENTHAAKLTLTCQRDPEHVVTKDAAIEVTGNYADCENDGELTYTATVVYNGKTYKDSKTETEKAIGHVHGTEYTSDEQGHAFECVNCGEKVEAEPHKWVDENGKVLTEQTCAQDGVAEFQCAVCGYKCEKVLEKTGLHDYDEYGNCKVCNFRKDACEHNSFHAEYVPVEGLTDVQLLVYTCDCGEKISDTELVGDFSTQVEVTYDRAADGTLLTKETTIYKDTGVVKTSVSSVANSGNDCKSVISFQDTYVLNGKTIGEYQYSWVTENHTTSKVKGIKTISSSDGKCSATYYVVSCACGQHTEFIETASTHEWVQDERAAVETEICAVCHDKRVWISEEKDDTYKITLQYTTLDDKPIDQLTNSGVFAPAVHDYSFDYELLGDECRDGVIETVQCMDPDCGIRFINILDGEHGIFTDRNIEEYDLREYGYDVVIMQNTCLCGKHSYIDVSGCNFEWESYDEKTGEDIYQCRDCGLKEIIRTEDDRDEQFTHGQYTVTQYITFADEEGNALLKLRSVWDSELHSYDREDGNEEELETFLLGDSCEDGIIVKATCEDCGKATYWLQNRGHYYRTKTSYDLSDKLGVPLVLREEECICGENHFINDNYRWTWDHNDEENGASVEVCQELGLYREMLYTYSGNKDANCVQNCRVEVTYLDQDGTVKATQVMDTKLSNHSMGTRTYKLLGESCLDGYEVTEQCDDCGYTISWTDDNVENHNLQIKETIDLAEYGISCGGTVYTLECPCGECKGYSVSRMNCDFVWQPYDESTGVHVGVCSKCGAIRQDKEEAVGEKDDQCNVKRSGEITFMDSTKTKSFTLKYQYIGKEHNYGFPVVDEWLGDSCEDGVHYTVTCLDCGSTESNYTNEHRTFVKNIYDLQDYGFCGGTVKEYACLCGEKQYVSRNTKCRFEGAGNESSDEWDYINHYECPECKGQYYSYDRTLSQEGCYRLAELLYQYIGPEGKEFQILWKENRGCHEYVADGDFTRNGDSCSDGWSINLTCSACGDKIQRRGSSHEAFCVEQKKLADIGACEGGSYNKYSCSCGENSWEYADIYNDEACKWQFQYRATNTDAIREIGQDPSKATNSDAIKNITAEVLSGLKGAIDVYKCSVCGTYRFESREDEILYTEGCYDYYNVDSVIVGSRGSISYQTVAGYSNHDLVRSYSFPGERDCEAGVMVTETCSKCGWQNSYKRNYHEMNVVGTETIDGSCGMVLTHRQCPCGKQDNYILQSDCSWQYSYQDGVSVATCTKCNFVKKSTNDSQYDRENCSRTSINHYEIYNSAGEKVKEYDSVSKYKQHDYILVGTEGEVTADACNNGITVTQKCSVCGDVSTSVARYHSYFVKEKYYLTDYGIGQSEDAYIAVRSCVCGQNSWLDDQSGCNWSYKGQTSTENGYVTSYQCEDCQATWTVEETEGEKDGCYRPITAVYTYTYPNAEPIIFRTNSFRVEHDMVRTSSLKPGSVSCTDGIIIVEKCKNCDYSYSHEANWHDTNVVDEVDVTEYGSKCGGKITVYNCPCGESASINTYNLNCDMGYQDTANWIEGTVESGNQYNIDGWQYFSTTARIYRCAVTDPEQCGFTYRYASYYKPAGETCKVNRYETYQLGYNEETGTCAKEITVKTDSNVTMHNYAVEQQTVTGADGLKQDITKYTCKDCGSTYEEIQTYETVTGSNANTFERKTQYSRKVVNTLNDENDKQVTYLTKYTYPSESSAWDYESYNRNEYIHADGSVMWNETYYEYDWSNCSYVRTEVDSYGNSWSNSGQSHRALDTEWVVESNATCTQYEKKYQHSHCTVCGTEVTRSQDYWHGPNGHNFSWNQDKNVYVCSTCGLESVNGTSGSIWMEDLSQKYADEQGNMPDYVVGYYNATNVNFSYYLGVVLNDQDQHTSDDDEIVLTGIEFTELHRENDGVEAISFSRSRAKEAAEAAIAAYKEKNSISEDTEIAYNLRFTFVPAGDDSTLDYAITFTE